ncbi:MULTISPECIES: glycosyltransferase family 2 protein [Streptomyces]|jgi:glycosyltransferase involved in cell wall biosynthesis|uniref:Sugar transferase n=2 Tax=Streptomyces griseoaurantiacus TaxID=68213 RepID=F3NL85_9ACTN|nr:MULTISPECIES: glycosyltransferase family 2 protein [Streptomyces]GHE40369.1 glycosyl transferase [Streptomyces griseoaurantiacus]EGG45811.1 sugar transferase [Streptomyces griseoaurantiacus M045]MCF0089592.1 putative glycosyltransferase CsbB [Streptomyces sp. MH192]MCF0102436.1 putative glycosyltransferase CsbB [Streptomyces sp. MH191]MDX3087859.1 glycosyltransferase family 2 protein [Streptomyces sp. ME12-02E]
MLISIVAPCHNEEDVVAHFHEEVAKAADALLPLGHDTEFVYVDDGSRDRTLPLLRSLADRDRRVRYVSLSRNFGKEAALLAGLRHASGDCVVVMDADLQHPPRLIPRMVELHAQGYDQVMARRDRGGDRLTRTLTARLYYRIVNRLVDVELVDGVGDFRLLSRRVVDAVLSMSEYNRFSKGLFAWVGFPGTTLAYRNEARTRGRSSWTLKSLLNYGLDGLLSFNNRPLRAALHLGLGLLLCAALYTAWIVGAALVHGVRTPGYVTTITAVTALAGVQMVMLGVVGEYTGRIYYEAKRRPHFLVKASNVQDAAAAPDPAAAESGADVEDGPKTTRKNLVP